MASLILLTTYLPCNNGQPHENLIQMRCCVKRKLYYINLLFSPSCPSVYNISEVFMLSYVNVDW